jgi:hypothetical protein
VQISGAGSDRYVTLSFRQEKSCSNLEPGGDLNYPAYIELKAENFVNNAKYSTVVTVGTYDLFTSTFDEEGVDQQLTDEYPNFKIDEGGIELDIFLPPTP